jgi:DNA polymerase-3 subunit beta
MIAEGCACMVPGGVMKFSLVQSELYRSLQLVAGVVPTKTAAQHLTSILVEATENGELRFTGTDLDAFLVTSLHASVEQPGIAAIPARRLLEVVRELPGDVVEISSTASGISIHCGNGRFRIVGPDPQEFPPLPELNEEKIFAVSSSVLARLVAQTAYAASTDYTRPEQTAVFVHVVGGDLRFVATNGHRLAMAFHAADYPAWADVLVPTKTLAVLQRLLSEAQESVSISANKRYCLFNLGSTRLYTRLLDGPFPPYQQAIPSGCDSHADLDREVLAAALRRVTVFSESATRMVKVTIDSGRLGLAAEAHDVGEASEAVSADYEGPQFRTGFNGGYLLDLLKTMTTDRVRISFKESGAASIFEPTPLEGKPDLLCLVMPLRLQDEPARGGETVAAN